MVVMNKHTALEALRFAAMGRTVAVLGDTMPQAQEVLHDMMDVYPEELTAPRVRRAHGRHAIHFEGGGRITFHTFRSAQGLRGYSLDRLYVPLGTDPHDVVPLTPCLAVSGGPVIGYIS